VRASSIEVLIFATWFNGSLLVLHLDLQRDVFVCVAVSAGWLWQHADRAELHQGTLRPQRGGAKRIDADALATFHLPGWTRAMRGDLSITATLSNVIDIIRRWREAQSFQRLKLKLKLELKIDPIIYSTS
jgi:hypothetical protein